jgi:peptidoglycan/LPS O-acetylase OafA/YrhL
MSVISTRKSSAVEPQPDPIGRVPGPRARELHQLPLSMLLILAGLWLFICSWALGYPDSLGNDPHLVETGAGIIVFLTGLARLSRPRGRATDLLVTAVGVGLILSGFFSNYGVDVIRWNQVATGCVLALLGLAGAMLAERAHGAEKRDGSTARTGSPQQTARRAF